MSVEPDFVKYQALGNDYLVLDPQLTDLRPDPESVRLLCDRHLGIGADGVLFGPVAPVRAGEPIGLRIFNSDGTECERSGNGIRMFALYVAERHQAGDEFVVRTLAGDSPVRILDSARGVVRVGMGLPRVATGRRLTVDGRELDATFVDVGNPHAVVRTAEVSREMAHELGPRIAGHPSFPAGANVQLLRVLDRGAIQIEIWERGSGYTLASGSSSCAAASAARALGLVDDAVRVHMPGGTLEVAFAADGALAMTGPAEQVASGSYAPALRVRLGR